LITLRISASCKFHKRRPEAGEAEEEVVVSVLAVLDGIFGAPLIAALIAAAEVSVTGVEEGWLPPAKERVVINNP
jgi:hypothetical protein